MPYHRSKKVLFLPYLSFETKRSFLVVVVVVGGGWKVTLVSVCVHFLKLLDTQTQKWTLDTELDNKKLKKGSLRSSCTFAQKMNFTKHHNCLEANFSHWHTNIFHFCPMLCQQYDLTRESNDIFRNGKLDLEITKYDSDHCITPSDGCHGGDRRRQQIEIQKKCGTWECFQILNSHRPPTLKVG